MNFKFIKINNFNIKYKFLFIKFYNINNNKNILRYINKCIILSERNLNFIFNLFIIIFDKWRKNMIWKENFEFWYMFFYLFFLRNKNYNNKYVQIQSFDIWNKIIFILRSFWRYDISYLLSLIWENLEDSQKYKWFICNINLNWSL